MPSLADTLLEPAARPNVVQDCVTVIEDEVRSKSGLGGLAIKAVFKTVKAFKPGIIPDMVNVLLDDFVGQLEPFYTEFQETGEDDFGSYTVRHADRVAETLLAITDGRANRSRHKSLVKAYQKLRPQGKKQVVTAMPRISAMLTRQGI